MTNAFAPSFRLEGGTAFVTGAGGGIGRSIVLGLFGSGARVGCADVPATLASKRLPTRSAPSRSCRSMST